MASLQRLITILFVLTAQYIFLAGAAWSQPPNQQLGPQPAAGPPLPPQAAAQPPRPFPLLNAAHEKALNQVLDFWAKSSANIQRYSATFGRWEWDPVFGPKNTFNTYSQGIVQYGAPDKGLFQDTEIRKYSKPADPTKEPEYVPLSNEHLEHWICDGKSIIEMDGKNRRVVQQELPPEMQGKSIVDGPLPFLFGVSKERIHQRYWVHLVTPPNTTNEYWLEAFPKRQHDAANYKKVHVIIAQEDFLPKGLVIFAVNYDERTNPARTTFAFENRRVNWNDTLEKLNVFNRAFYQPKVPSGWQKVVQKYEPPPLADQQRIPPRENKSLR
jgi:TIGR03009 family protein